MNRGEELNDTKSEKRLTKRRNNIRERGVNLKKTRKLRRKKTTEKQNEKSQELRTF